MHEALDHAIAELGGLRATARQMGVSPSAVSDWRRRGRVPAKWAIPLERATQARVTRYSLRPDIYPR